MTAMPDNFFGEAFGETEPFLIGFLIFFLIFYLLILVFSIVSYVLSSVGMYTVAKRRGIHHPWLAWIPVGSSWILGSISDQYQYVAKGKIRNRRKWLLGLNIVSLASPIAMVIAEVVTLIAGIGSGMDPVAGTSSGTFFGIFITLWLVMIAFMIVLAVFTYMSLYDLFNSCNPNNAVMFLVLSIFISVTQPFFVFSCRKKDLGMPPRKSRESAAPAALPTQPEEVPAEPAVAPEASGEAVADDADFADVEEQEVPAQPLDAEDAQPVEGEEEPFEPEA